MRRRAHQACSSWTFASDHTRAHFADHLRADLDSGRWDSEHGHLQHQPFYEGSLVLIRAVRG